MNTKLVKKSVKKQTKASVLVPAYRTSYDLLMSAVDYTRRGMPNKAAKALADAAQDPDIDEAMQQLNEQQQALMDKDFGVDPQQQQQQQTSRALARLIKASQQSQQDDEDSEQDEEEDGDGDDKEDSKVETAGDDFDSEDDLDIEMDGDDFTEQQEQQVQSSVQARLAQRERNRKTRA